MSKTCEQSSFRGTSIHEQERYDQEHNMGGEQNVMNKRQEIVTCQICQKQKNVNEVIPGELVSESLVEIIRKEHPTWSSSGVICLSDLNSFRAKRVKDILESEKGEISNVEEQVLKSLKEHELLSMNVNTEFDRQLTLGERLADKLTRYAGSWSFIVFFGGIIFLWIAINSYALLLRPFDPYPFILLNLVLSCVAAMQAPIILMSQNREGAKDRLRAEYDYRVNLKAELEIRHLHEKLDHLLINQWHKLLEIQEIQTELMEELALKKTKH
jgi:uncharacterized membrane protein